MYAYVSFRSVCLPTYLPYLFTKVVKLGGHWTQKTVKTKIFIWLVFIEKKKTRS